MSRLPSMTVQPFRLWAASTESIMDEGHDLSQGPLQALQNILYTAEEKKRGERWLKSKFLLYLHHPEIICPLPNSFQTIQANKFNAWHRAISHAESLNSVPSELMRLTGLISETKHRWYVKKKHSNREPATESLGAGKTKQRKVCSRVQQWRVQGSCLVAKFMWGFF